MFVPTVLAVLCGFAGARSPRSGGGTSILARAQLAVVESAEQTKAGSDTRNPRRAGRATVPYHATVIEELKAWRVRQAQELLRLGIRADGDTFVVTQADGTRCSRTV